MSIKDAEAPAPNRSAKPPAAGRWSTLGVVTLGTFLLALDLTVVNVALPSLRVSLHANFADLQWVIDAYALTLAVFLLTSGSLADRIGRKRVFNAGFFLFTAASLMCGLGWNITSVIIARGVQGVGAAVLFATGPALIGQVFRGKERGKAFSLFGGGVGLGLALGPLIGGALTDSAGWRWIFLINVPIGVVCLALGLFGIRESRAQRTHPVDLAGLVTFSAALALLVLALLRGQHDGWGSARIVGEFIGAAVMFAVFAIIQVRLGEAAMLDLRLLRNRTFIGISVIAALMTATSMSAIFLLISYTQNMLGYTAGQTGVRFLTLTGALFVSAAIGGLLTAKVPFRIIVGLGGTFLAAGLFAIRPLVDAQSDWTALIPGMILMGIGIGMYNPARAAISIAVAEPAKAGMASGINETFQQAGWALGVAGFGALFQARVTDHFTGSPVGRQLGSAANQLGGTIAAGSFADVTKSVPPALSGQVGTAAKSAFLAGLLDVTPATAALTVLSALIGFIMISNRDLDPSALGGMPGVPPEIAEEDLAPAAGRRQ
jgi:EmrB/QacA subfamily drug resistance transporter